MFVALPPDQHRFNFSLSAEVVKRASFDAIAAVDVLPAPEFAERWCAAKITLPIDCFRRDCLHIFHSGGVNGIWLKRLGMRVHQRFRPREHIRARH